MRLGEVRLELERPPIGRNGLVVAAERLQGIAEVNVRRGAAWFRRQHGLVASGRFIGTLERHQRIAETHVHPRELRVECQRRPIVLDGIGMATACGQRHAQVHVRGDEIGPQRERSFVILDRLGQAILHLKSLRRSQMLLGCICGRHGTQMKLALPIVPVAPVMSNSRSSASRKPLLATLIAT